MAEDTNTLIERLAGEAEPVKPLAPPALRAGVFVAAVVAVMGAFVAVAGHPMETLEHLSDPRFAAELAGALYAGVAAILAAVMLSIPGRSEAWIYLPLPGVALWLAGGAIECYGALAAGFEVQSLFQARDCFWFILSAGLPVAAGAYVLLRRTVALHLLPVTALAGLSAALLAAVLLQFMHAHGTDPVDFVSHIAAVAAVVVLMMTAGRVGLSRV